MGGTAIGTGLNAPRGLRREVRRAPGEDHRQADPPRRRPGRGHAGHAGLRALLLGLKSLAIKLSKICNDLRLLSSRPARGPARDQPAGACSRAPRSCPARSTRSSPRSSTRSASGVIGNDLTVTMAAEARAAPAQRDGAGDRRVHLRGADAVHQRGPHPARATASTASPPTRRSAAASSSDSIGIVTALNPVHRLRQGDRARRRGAEDRQGRRRAGAREEAPDRGADREGARSRRP